MLHDARLLHHDHCCKSDTTTRKKCRTATCLIGVLAMGLVIWAVTSGSDREFGSQATTCRAAPAGRISDYFAVANRRLSEGVTPENNAAVLDTAFGPGHISKERAADISRCSASSRPRWYFAD
jgi:hypothetical protein